MLETYNDKTSAFLKMTENILKRSLIQGQTPCKGKSTSSPIGLKHVGIYFSGTRPTVYQ